MTRAQRWTMVAVVVGSGIVFLDTSVVNLALPRMAEELPSSLFAPLEAQSYVAGSYFLTLSALLILAGALTDRYGRRLFALGLAGFGAISLLCALAPTMELLIVFRVLQGAAGAFVVPGSLSIITANFQGEEQGRAFGIWAGASALTTLLGPFVGGVLVNSVSWRAAFFLNLPFLVLAYLATVRHVAESRDEQATGRVDWLGSVVVVVAVAGLAFGTIRGQQTGWQGSEAFVSLAAGAVAAVLFPVLTLRSTNPLVPPGLFRSRNFTVTNLSTFVIYGALYVCLTFLGLFLIGTPPAAYLVDLLPGLVLFGVGLVVLVAPLTTALMTSVPEANAGVASAVNNAVSGSGRRWSPPSSSWSWCRGSTGGRAAGPRGRRRVGGVPRPGGAAQPARPRGRPAGRRGSQGGIHQRLPPVDAGRGRAHGRRGGHQRGRDPQPGPSRRPTPQRHGPGPRLRDLRDPVGDRADAP